MGENHRDSTVHTVCAVCRRGLAEEFARTFYDRNVDLDQILNRFLLDDIDLKELIYHIRHDILSVLNLDEPQGRRLALIEFIRHGLKELRGKKITHRAVLDAIMHLDKIDLGVDQEKQGMVNIMIGGPVLPSEVNMRLEEIERQLEALEAHKLKPVAALVNREEEKEESHNGIKEEEHHIAE